jgi:hypothetical protein
VVQRDFFCSANHSMESFAYTVLVGCGFWRCSAASAYLGSVPAGRLAIVGWQRRAVVLVPWGSSLMNCAFGGLTAAHQSFSDLNENTSSKSVAIVGE